MLSELFIFSLEFTRLVACAYVNINYKKKFKFKMRLIYKKGGKVLYIFKKICLILHLSFSLNKRFKNMYIKETFFFHLLNVNKSYKKV